MNKTKDKILQIVSKKAVVYCKDLIKRLDMSRQAINKHINSLVREGKIVKQGSSRATAFYVLNNQDVIKKLSGEALRFKKRILSCGAEEDVEFRGIEKQRGFLNSLTENDRENLRYAFTEMLNNAIDHSKTKYIDYVVSTGSKNVSFSVVDKGVGIFQNIMDKKSLGNELDAIQDLLKGKTTTDKKYHSGEGIYFTSKIAGRFIIESHRKRLIIDNKLDDVFIEDRRYLKGTTVSYYMDLPSKKKMIALFHEYANEDFKFDKSSIKVKLFDDGESYISRSQAKRLLHSMEKFGVIELDFAGVKTIGQAFADEVFRVYKQLHPETRIEWKNASENVEFIIKRALQE